MVLLGGGVSDESVWGGGVNWTVAVKLGGPRAEVSGALSVLPFLSAACVLDVSWPPRVVLVTCPEWCGGLGGRSRDRTYAARRRLKFFPTAGAHSTDQHS